MKKQLAVFFLLTSGLAAAGQQIIAQWNFNTPLPPDNNVITGSLVPSMGNGSVGLVGGALPSGANPFNNGTDNDQFTNGNDNSAWNIRNFPIQGTLNKTAGIQFNCSTVGYQNIEFRFDEKHSASSPNTTVVQYNPDTTNPSGWIDIQVNKLSDTTYSETYVTHIINFSGITAVDNRPRLGIRIVAAFDPDSSSQYIATYFKTAAAYNPTGGTIRFDLATFSGTPSAGCLVPVTQAYGVELISTTDSSIRFSYHRGSGDSVLIVARAGFAVNTYPQAGMAYRADPFLGSGAQLGTGNYAVGKSARPGKDTVTIRGLAPGQIYYFAVFEFSGGHCYKLKPLYFYFTAGSTIFRPGELLIIGFDSRLAGNGLIGSGNDVYYLTNLVPIKPGTRFSITASRFEAGAPPNIRTNRWYNSGDYIYRDPDIQEFTWNGNYSIPSGSVIGLEDKLSSSGAYDSVTINGLYAPEFTSDSRKGELNAATYNGKGEQIFVTQGPFYPVGEYYQDRYNILFGPALSGITFFADWVPVSASPGIASSGIGFRQSRAPFEMECLKLSNLSDTVGAGYYMGPHAGTKRQLKGIIDRNSNWKWLRGDTLMNLSTDFTAPYTGMIGEPFTVNVTTLNPADGTWAGNISTDWLDCGNWEGLYVPPYNADVFLNSGAVHYPVIQSRVSCKSITANDDADIQVLSGGIIELGVDQ